jgi:hypothetical protein
MMIYACGGAGINIVNPIQSDLESKEGFSSMDVVYIDTSMSNISKRKIDKSQVYCFEGIDGSGKKRDTNYAVIRDSVNEILLSHQPGDINLVVHSTSGGSGSVLGPVIASELLGRGIPTIILAVSNKDSRIEIQNTINAIKSYSVIATKRNKPVILGHYENNTETPRSAVDRQVQAALKVISAVFSGKNAELDSADLDNFLDYTRCTSFDAGLAKLEFFTQGISLNKGEVIASLVTLSKEGEDTSPGIPVEYQAVGFMNPAATESINIQTPIHLGCVLGYFNGVIESLEKDIRSLEEVRRAFNVKSISSSIDHSSATDDGLIL